MSDNSNMDTTKCWKCSGSGLKPVKIKDFKGEICKVCTKTVAKPFIKVSKPYRPFRVHIDTGPSAKYNMYDPQVAPGDGEMLTSLCGKWCLYQHENGHRMTTDDVCVAAIACQQPIQIKSYLDLGTGLGSVLNMINWKKFQEIEECCGLEVQEANYRLAKKTIEFNGIDHIVTLFKIDMRVLLTEAHQCLSGKTFDLITGTPPYFPLNQKSLPEEIGRGLCAFEIRGGIEVYLTVAALFLKRNGTFVVVNGFLQADRTIQSGLNLGFWCKERWDIHGKADKYALFCVFVFIYRPDFIHAQDLPVPDYCFKECVLKN
jgi:tRNA1Val (adenine37-N6)-methyltransferase